MKLLTLGNRTVAIGLLWFVRNRELPPRRQARSLMSALAWKKRVVMAIRSGTNPQLGIGILPKYTSRRLYALAPLLTRSDGDHLFLFRLDAGSAWLLAIRRGTILVHGDRIISWSDRDLVMEEFGSHLDNPTIKVIEEAETATLFLSSCLTKTPSTRLVSPRSRTEAYWALTALSIVMTTLFFVPSPWSTGTSPKLTHEAATTYWKFQFERLWYQGHSPHFWQEQCLPKLLGLDIFSKGDVLTRAICHTDILAAHYRSVSTGIAAREHSTRFVKSYLAWHANNAGLPKTLLSPERATVVIRRALQTMKVHVTFGPWRHCVSGSHPLPSPWNHYRCRRVRIVFHHDAPLRLELLLHTLRFLPSLRINVISVHFRHSWSLQGRLYAQAI